MDTVSIFQYYHEPTVYDEIVSIYTELYERRIQVYRIVAHGHPKTHMTLHTDIFQFVEMAIWGLRSRILFFFFIFLPELWLANTIFLVLVDSGIEVFKLSMCSGCIRRPVGSKHSPKINNILYIIRQSQKSRCLGSYANTNTLYDVPAFQSR